MNNELEILVINCFKSRGKEGKSVKTKISYAYNEMNDDYNKGLTVLKEDWFDDNGVLFSKLEPLKRYNAITTFSRYGTNVYERLSAISDENGNVLFSRN